MQALDAIPTIAAEFAEAFGRESGGRLTTFWMALIASAYAIQATTRLRSEESAVRAEPILATPVGRPRWLASHLTMALVGGVAILVAIGLGMGTAHAISSGSAGEVPRVVAAALVYAPAVAVLAGAAVAVFGLAPRATGAIWAAFGVIGFLEMFGPLLQLPGWVYDVSPFQHVPQMPVADFSIAPLAVPSAIAATLIATGTVAFRRRDIAA